MLSKFSKWLIYAASYSPAYIILAIRLLLSPQEEAESLLQKISLNYTLNTPAIITLSGSDDHPFPAAVERVPRGKALF